ncbi:unnamed protein product [Mycena citricolor]|uniref:Uncharacterized protein n=1 Tax=Mycena citricolor TaxID=2018698 RepID=A0AAD2HE01_9AGAR|nr:unnamed protein product [Mycena citricolor]
MNKEQSKASIGMRNLFDLDGSSSTSRNPKVLVGFREAIDTASLSYHDSLVIEGSTHSIKFREVRFNIRLRVPRKLAWTIS